MATKYIAVKPIKHGKTHYRPGDEITGFTDWWRYWQYLRYNRVDKVDTTAAPVLDSLTPGNLELTVAFTAEAVGGDPFTDVEYSLDGGAWNSSGGTSSPFTIGQLVNGQSYSVRVRANNEAGAGPASNAVAGTPRTVPSAPTGLAATPGSGQLSISFTPGSNGGSAITNYQWRVGTTGTYTDFSPVDTTSPVVVTGLAPSVLVTVYIRAINAAGAGTSASVSGTPTA